MDVIQAWGGRSVILIAMVDAATPTVVSFQGEATGSNTDPFPANNVLSANTTVIPANPPNLIIEQPLDGTIIHQVDAANGILLAAEVVDDDDLSQEIEWSSDRIGTLGTGSEVMTGPIEDLGGHTIAATVTDSCNNTTSDSVNIGVAPADPITVDNLVMLDNEGEQGLPDIASTGTNSFVVVWSEVDVNDGEDADGSVLAQRFNSMGEQVGEEFLVNSETDGLQYRPAIAGQRDGSFIVVWQNGPDDAPDIPADIRLRQFDSQGVPSDELQVNLDTTERNLHPDVASQRDGSFLVAWERRPSQGNNDSEVIARYFDSLGNGLEAFQVNTYQIGMQGRPALVSSPDGGFIAAWQSQGSFQNDNDGYSIQMRRFNEFLDPQSAEVQVNRDFIEGDQTDPSMDGNLEGHLVVVWKGTTSTSDAQKRTLRIGGGTVNSLGEWSQDDFEVIEHIVLGPNNPFQLSPPDVAQSPDGDFVVIWADSFESTDLLSVQVLPFFGLNNSPRSFGDPLSLDTFGLGLPTIAYSHSDFDSATTNFFAFWETEENADGSTFEGPMEALDVTGGQISLPFPPLQADLSLTVSDTPDPVTEGDPLTFTIQVENLGPADAVAVEVVAELPTDWTFLSSPDCVQMSPNIICQLGTVQAGEVRGLLVNGQVHLGAPASIDHRVEVFSATPGTTGAPVIVVGTTDVLSLATELSLTVSDTPDPATEGRPLDFNIQVENLGPADAAAVDVVAELSTDWTFLSSPDCAPPAPDVICQLGTIQVGEIRNLVVSGFVHLGAPTSIDHRVEVFSAIPGTIEDPVIAVGTTTVLPAPSEDVHFADSFESGNTAGWSDSQPFSGELDAPRIED